MKIALASPRIATSLDDGLARVDALVRRAAAEGARIVCFPEAYLPGLRGLDFAVLPWSEDIERRVVKDVGAIARAHDIAVILGLEHVTPHGRQIAAVVFDRRGELSGAQVKTQLDPTEDRFYVPGDSRRMFEVEGLRFGIAICHEGWRYPETVRWAAQRGAHIVFHPQHTGSETQGARLTEWGAASNPYYEKAMMMRSIENGIWFASVNYALRYPEAATSIIDPAGVCHAFLPYGEEGVLVRDIDLDRATGHLARRLAPERYRESNA
ncbi:MAG TPA: carbon-nitrogen hydrolase family protein [Gemmatimonadaceae bacterium]